MTAVLARFVEAVDRQTAVRLEGRLMEAKGRRLKGRLLIAKVRRFEARRLVEDKR